MPDETEPTAATPPAAEERPPERTEENATAPAHSGVHVPKWLAVGVVAVVLAGGGFAVGRTTASDNHGGFVPIGNNRPGGGPGGPGGFGRGPGGGPGGEYGRGNGPGGGAGSNGNDNGGSSGNDNSGSSGSTTPSTTAGTGT